MNAYHIYLEHELPFDDCAALIRKLLNVNAENTSKYQKEQKRYGENYGDVYYLFEVLGMEIYFVMNKNEMLESDYEEYPYYLILHINNFSEKVLGSNLAAYIYHYLIFNKFKSALEP